MAFDMSNPLGFFFANGPQSQSYEAVAARRKIAEAMMARQTKYPKNIGEGLSAIGEAIGDRGYYNNVLADEAAAKGYESKAIGTPAPPPSSYVPYSPSVGAAAPPQKTSEATPDDTAPPPAPVAAAIPADTTAQAGGDPWTGRSNAIAGIESGGAKNPYALVGARTKTGDRAIGKYQVMGNNVPEWTQAALGAPMTAEQFRNSPDAQEAVFKHRFGQYVNKYGEEGAARAWFGGEGGMRNPNATDVHGRLTVAGYGQDYLKRLGGAGGGAAPGPRDQIAAAMTPSTVVASATPDSDPQEATFGDVIGMQKAPTAGYAFPPTASNRTGDVQSDAAPLGIRPTGGLGGDSPAAASVADTVQSRGDAIKGPIPITPEPPQGPGAQMAQVTGGGSAAAGVTATDASTAPAPLGAALPSPQIRKAPEVPPLGPKPAPPQLMPTENARTQHFEAIAADPRLSPTARQQAATQAQAERAQVNSFNAQKIQEYNEYLKPWIAAEQKLKDPATIYTTEKARRELEADIPVPMTDEQRAAFHVPEGLPAAITRNGVIQYGPSGTNIKVDTGAKAQSKGDERLQEKLSEHFIAAFDEGNKAGDDIKQIAEMRALAARVGTGAGAVVKQYLGQWGIKSQGLDDIQALQAGISRMIPTQRVPGSGTSSDFDADNFKNALFSLSKSDGGNRLIFDTMEGLAKNKLARADIAGQVISSQITREQGVVKMLELQREAKALSEKVKAFTDATNPKPAPQAIIPTDDAMRKFLEQNPNHPKADEIRKHLGITQ